MCLLLYLWIYLQFGLLTRDDRALLQFLMLVGWTLRLIAGLVFGGPLSRERVATHVSSLYVVAAEA